MIPLDRAYRLSLRLAAALSVTRVGGTFYLLFVRSVYAGRLGMNALPSNENASSPRWLVAEL
jgi:hypothetical protein